MLSAYSGRGSLADLYSEVIRDTSASTDEKNKLISGLQTQLGTTPLETPVNTLPFRGLGAAAGFVASSYFGLGIPARVLSTALGFGLGSALKDKVRS
jgi:hypothetical protein